MPYINFIISIVTVCCSIQFIQAAVFFPSNSAYGIFAAIAVPIDLPHRNVFVSYNFEANYNLPRNWSLPMYATDIEDEGFLDEILFDGARLNSGNECTNCTKIIMREVNDDKEHGHNDTLATSTNKTASKRKPREISSLLTRTHFYHILIDKFQRSGFRGEPCLLRLICETNFSELGDINGVLGNIIHIMFSPTTSKNEHLPMKYYEAEVKGTHDQCHHYKEECSESLLDLISTPIHRIIDRMQTEL